MKAEEIAELIVYYCQTSLEQLRGIQPIPDYKPVEVNIYRQLVEVKRTPEQVVSYITEAVRRIASLFESVSVTRN